MKNFTLTFTALIVFALPIFATLPAHTATPTPPRHKRVHRQYKPAKTVIADAYSPLPTSKVLRMMVMDADNIQVIVPKPGGSTGYDLSQYSLAQILDYHRQHNDKVQWDEFFCQQLEDKSASVCGVRVEETLPQGQKARFGYFIKVQEIDSEIKILPATTSAVLGSPVPDKSARFIILK